MTPAVLIDIDNVLIQTALRKQAILRDVFGIDWSIDAIENDYELDRVFGQSYAYGYQSFFQLLNSSHAINDYPASAFPYAQDTLEFLKQSNCNVLLLTGRAESLREATVGELRLNGITEDHYDGLFMLPTSERTESNLENEKQKIMASINDAYELIAHVGDRPSDIRSAKSCRIPAVLFRPASVANICDKNSADALCQNWFEVRNVLSKFLSRNTGLLDIRQRMSDKYSAYLSDIDAKARANISVAGIIVALSGGLIFRTLDQSSPDSILIAFLFVIFALSALSLIFSIKTLTARSTSGNKAGQELGVPFMRLLVYAFLALFDKSTHKHRLLDENDPILVYDRFKRSTAQVKRQFHYDYYADKYSTLDPEIMVNATLFSLMAANYEKVHTEKIASKILILTIVAVIVLVLFEIVRYLW